MKKYPTYEEKLLDFYNFFREEKDKRSKIVYVRYKNNKRLLPMDPFLFCPPGKDILDLKHSSRFEVRIKKIIDMIKKNLFMKESYEERVELYNKFKERVVSERLAYEQLMDEGFPLYPKRTELEKLKLFLSNIFEKKDSET